MKAGRCWLFGGRASILRLAPRGGPTRPSQMYCVTFPVRLTLALCGLTSFVQPTPAMHKLIQCGRRAPSACDGGRGAPSCVCTTARGEAEQRTPLRVVDHRLYTEHQHKDAKDDDHTLLGRSTARPYFPTRLHAVCRGPSPGCSSTCRRNVSGSAAGAGGAAAAALMLMPAGQCVKQQGCLTVNQWLGHGTMLPPSPSCPPASSAATQTAS